MDIASGRDRVSIVVPTRDRMARLDRTVRNLLRQTYPDVEVVVSDDGSSDGTLQALAALDDDRLVVVAAPDPLGVSAARNRGIAAATGRWVAVCDDDDLWHPEKLAIQVGLLERTGARWAFCGAVSVTDELCATAVVDATVEGFARRLRQGNPVPGGCSSAIVERSLLEEVHGFDPGLSMFADYDLWIRLHTRATPVAVPDCLVVYVEHDGQMSKTKVRPAIDELRRVRAEHRSLLGTRRDASSQSVDRWLVTRLREAGHRGAAMRYLLEERSAFSPRDLGSLALRACAARPRPTWPGRPPEACCSHPTVEAVLEPARSGSSPPGGAALARAGDGR